MRARHIDEMHQLRVEIDRLRTIEEAAQAAWDAVAKSGDHVSWFPALGKLGAALNGGAAPDQVTEADAHEQSVPAWSAERCRAVDRSNIPATCDWPRCCGQGAPR